MNMRFWSRRSSRSRMARARDSNSAKTNVAQQPCVRKQDVQSRKEAVRRTIHVEEIPSEMVRKIARREVGEVLPQYPQLLVPLRHGATSLDVRLDQRRREIDVAQIRALAREVLDMRVDAQPCRCRAPQHLDHARQHVGVIVYQRMRLLVKLNEVPPSVLANVRDGVPIDAPIGDSGHRYAHAAEFAPVRVHVAHEHVERDGQRSIAADLLLDQRLAVRREPPDLRIVDGEALGAGHQRLLTKMSRLRAITQQAGVPA